MVIQRDDYLNKIIRHKNNGLIKVITGMRRVGKSLKKKLEVDFIAQKGNEKYYIQSAYDMRNSEKRNQEERSLLNIPDSFKKVIMVKDQIMPTRNDFGVITIGLLDFLLGKVGLEY